MTSWRPGRPTIRRHQRRHLRRLHRPHHASLPGLGATAGLALHVSLLPGVVLPEALRAGADPAGHREICLIAPRVTTEAGGPPEALVSLERPTIFAVGSFEEVRIERGAQVLWRRLATALEPVEGPLRWPLAPIRAGESLVVRLRPVGGLADDFAAIRITGAPAAVMERTSALRRRLEGDAGAWRRAVLGELQRGDFPLAWGLLFAFEGPSSPDLDALRLEVFRRGCGGGDDGGRGKDRVPVR